jgi:2,4-dienoyl-CoA reductase-like NADH-dependent reductase (Old Yellow Enzyme family)
VERVESKLESSEFDLIAVGRAILANANWPNKIKEGLLNKVIPFSSDTLMTLT